MGGPSTEHDVSVVSGTGVVRAMDPEKYNIHPVLIDTLRSRHIDLTQYSAVWLFPLCFACFLLLSFGLSFLLLKIPGLKKLVS
jgi:D-alanine-D-alanine ligase-like ATP-grasp enzyme